jgi:hypothetical protein
MTEQNLHCAQVACAAVDQGRLRSPHGMGRESRSLSGILVSLDGGELNMKDRAKHIHHTQDYQGFHRADAAISETRGQRSQNITGGFRAEAS